MTQEGLPSAKSYSDTISDSCIHLSRIRCVGLHPSGVSQFAFPSPPSHFEIEPRSFLLSHSLLARADRYPGCARPKRLQKCRSAASKPKRLEEQLLPPSQQVAAGPAQTIGCSVQSLLLVGLDGQIGGGVGDASEDKTVLLLVVIQEGLVGLVHIASRELAGA